MGLTAFNRDRKLKSDTEKLNINDEMLKTEDTSIIDEMLKTENNMEEVKTEEVKKRTKKDIEKLKNNED